MRSLLTRRRRRLAVLSTLGAAVALPLLGLPALAAPAQAAPAAPARQAVRAAPAAPRTADATQSAKASQGFEPLPSLPVNACNNTSLPQDYGTNFPTPNDPYGFGYANQTVIGWEGNIYAPFAYLSGSYFARGVPDQYQQSGTTYCGEMYSFGIYDYGLSSGQAPAAGSVQWSEAGGYLPAMITSFTRDGLHVSITDFASKQAIAGSPAELVYTRITETNNGSSAVSAPPGQSGSGLVELDSAPDTIQPGQTVTHDFVAAVDTFTVGGTLPTTAQITPGPGHSGALPYDVAFGQMARYWNQRLSVAPDLQLPNVPLANTNNLADPGTAMDNAYKAAFIYTRIVESEKAQFSGANNYDWILNHDVPGILENRFTLGDFTDAQNLLLTARVSEQPSFNEYGANWYWDGLWKTPVAWADYLQATNDVAFVSKYFHDDASGPSQWGPSLYTMMHTQYLSQLSASTGYLKASGDNDSEGTWLFDDESALAGLAAYQYIATRIGNTTEAQWAAGAYASLLKSVNAGLAANEQASGFDFLPCEVNQPITADRCNTATDANWDGSNLWGQNVWDIFLEGGPLSGVLGDPSQTDNLYQMGLSRLQGIVPFPSFGAYSGYSTAHNTGYAAGALYGSQYRDLPITSYAWQIATTTGGPNAWWEANGSAPDPTNPWAGSHAAPQFGAIPYVWPMAGQTQTLIQSLAAEGLTQSAGPGGSTRFSNVLYIGRGVPDAWLAPGQTIAVSNLTSSYDVNSGQRATYGVRIRTFAGRGGPGHGGPGRGGKVVQVALSGQLPASNIQIQLPALATAGVTGVIGGNYDVASHTVVMQPGHRVAEIFLGDAARPGLSVQVTGTAPGTHPQPALLSGTATTASATITNNGQTTLRNVQLTLQAPQGWTSSATTGTSFASLAPGQSQQVSWSVTPPSTATGGAGIVVAASYDAGLGTATSDSAEQWVTVQRPLPLPPGVTDLALTGTASASYTSPWTTVDAINNGIYPIQSSDDNDLTPYWGTWPETGQQWIELDWSQPVTTNGSSVYFADDGGGLRLPASWTVQYWNGSAWTDVSGASTYPIADNTFNQVTFNQVTTTRLRVLMQSGLGSVGAVQWIVPSLPSS
jgi:NPCBM-associated, NEW3 domain of alpha-galactosidase